MEEKIVELISKMTLDEKIGQLQQCGPCYIHDVAAQRVRPVKELKAFTKIALNPGEESDVRFSISLEEMGYYNWDMEYVVEPGEYIIYVGSNSRDCLSQSICYEK